MSDFGERQETIIYGTEGRIELQVWVTSGGTTEVFRAYGNNDSFEDKTLVGLVSEVQAFIEGLRHGATFPKGPTLREHGVTIRAIWDGYQLLGRLM
jgi:hypothetical protein